ncbi:TetR/AcrR family transcriptional regulator [Curtobacterium sp. MCLR17_036]|uniref:TetR/AcrR family transcriptional regulator n=1 Tax=Curtobacterium sp. MCLR17_036 TaxID=2175620 RepID=UPI0015E8B255|nr:TetR/AcrR family transcriptional regulator [Curtobacterium sp. MCLR17_036]WIE63333.1 TetR/AcrR family transcriptional regulator [Curtobacterium sp. MCLR17_036]
MAATPSLRDQKKAALRDELSVTTVLLARERGLDNVRVEDIVRQVGVSRRTFGNYFSSKEDAIADRHVQRVRAAATDLAQHPDDEPLWAAVTAVLLAPYRARAVGPSGDDQSGLTAVLATPGMQSAVDRGARTANSVLAQAIAARLGVERDDPLPAAVAAAALSTLLTTLESWASSSDAGPLEPMLVAAFQRLGSGFDRLHV